MLRALRAIGTNPCKDCPTRLPDKPCPEQETCREKKKFEFRRKICKQVAYIRWDREWWLDTGHRKGAAISREREMRRFDE